MKLGRKSLQKRSPALETRLRDRPATYLCRKLAWKWFAGAVLGIDEIETSIEFPDLLAQHC